MSYQFGTNWSRFSEFAGNVVGPLIAYEVITAFFLEAAFLGIMLFGWERVGDRLHFFATCMVALGTLLSAFWILSANTWMQTPAGLAIENGMAVPVDWWRIVFNPSFPNRFAHMVHGGYLTTAFAVAGMSAWMILRAPRSRPRRSPARAARSRWRCGSPRSSRRCRSCSATCTASTCSSTSRPSSPPSRRNWERGRRAARPLRLAGRGGGGEPIRDRDPEARQLILTHDFGGAVPGLKDVPPDERPPVWPVFFSFRIMVGHRLRDARLGLWSLWLRWSGALFENRWFLRAAMLMTPSGFGAVLFGWFTAEIGRQPYVVYGLLRTADAVSPVTRGAVASSLVTFVVVYAFIFGFGSYYLAKLLRKGPEPLEEAARGADFGDRADKRAKRPLSVPDESLEAAAAGGPRALQPAE